MAGTPSLGAWVAWWLRRCATSRTVQGSIPGGVTGFFSDIFLPTLPWPWGRLSLSWQSHDKPKIHSGSTPSLQPRFGTFGLLVVSKLEGDVKGSIIFIGCRSWGGCAQMDQQQTRNFLHQRNREMDRTSEEMYGHKWWLCWKISFQCGRELNFLHFDITVIILHGQILILYNWRPYLSVTPRI